MSEDSLDLAAGLPADVLAAALLALGLGGAERERECEQLCSAHPQNADRLRRLFGELGAVERLLGKGYGTHDQPPAQLGPFRVLRRLGSGAFGEVYLCEQSEPVRRNVAVKVLRAGVADRTTLLRFAAERQLIASMQHPAIAQVFDAGVLADGRPYFVMDAIDGVPIDRWCNEHAASVEVRIELFADVCRGVQHAHERGIVHRDLKPANVLVVEVDGRPRPKVIDFGIAKILHRDDVRRSFATEAGRIVGTPGYMSPEQQQGASDDVDARADVFGLGVVLYELLCGQLPWAVGAATDSDAARPSTRVSGTTDAATAIARDRATQPRRLASRLRGDLDWIVLRCLHRERALRYPTVQELVDDLERHRRAEPVKAGPPSTAYRLRKLVRRHRTAFVTLGCSTLIVIGAAVYTETYRRSTEIELGAARARVDASFATATAAVERLIERANDPNVREAPEGDAARDAMLRDALSFYDTFLIDRPADPSLRTKRCQVLVRLTHVHTLLGDAARAGPAARATRDEAEALWRTDPTNLELRGLLGEALCEDGGARVLLGDGDGARASFAAAVDHLAASAARLPARFGCAHAIALRSLAAMLPISDERTLQLLREALGVIDALPADAGHDLAHEYVYTACELGENLGIVSRLAECESVLEQASLRLPQVTSERLHLTYRVSSLRANAAFQRGERKGTIEHYRAALAAVTAWEQAQPKRRLPRTLHLRALRSLGYGLNYAGAFDESVASYRAAIALGEDSIVRFPSAAVQATELTLALREFALTLYDRYDVRVLAEAESCAARAVAIAQGAGRQGTSEELWQLLGLRAMIADARVADGGDPWWPAVEAAVGGDLHPVGRAADELVGALVGVARWHLEHGRGEAASAWLQRADAWIAQNPSEHEKRSVDVAWLTARLAAARGDHAACAAAAERAVAARPTWFGRRRGADCLRLAWQCAGADPASSTAAAGYRDRALQWNRKVRADLDRDVAGNPDDPWFVLPWAFASVHAAELSVAAGDVAAALPLLESALPRLEAIRALAPADLWDEAACRDGLALQQRLRSPGR